MKTAIVYIAAAFAEIAGCFTFWMVFREGKPNWWLAPGMVSLALFAWLLTRVDSAAAGRAYAAMEGSILWHLWCGCGVWKGLGPTAGTHLEP